MSDSDSEIDDDDKIPNPSVSITFYIVWFLISITIYVLFR